MPLLTAGQLLSPAGGANIPSTQGYPTGKIDFSYKPVYISKTSNCGYYGCTAQTWYVSVALRDAKGIVTTVSRFTSCSQQIRILLFTHLFLSTSAPFIAR